MKILGVEIGEDRKAGRGGLGALLRRNSELRQVFADRPALQSRLKELQHWQSARLLRTHSDLRDSPRYRKAVDFFFKELYGGGDPQARDRDLLRVQRVMERLLPAEALRALTLAIELEVLSQELDAAVVEALPDGPINDENYAEAYRQNGRLDDRQRQIELISEIGDYLDHVVRRPIIRRLVRIARGPAHAAGFGELQELLEHGLIAFEDMQGASEFLATIDERELRAMRRIAEGRDDPFEFGSVSRRVN
jgi:hypothetical protein